MKSREVYHFLLVALLLFLGACSKESDLFEEAHTSYTRSLNPSKVSFQSESNEAFSETFKVESYAASWEFSSVADWFSLTPMNGTATSNILLSVDENRNAKSARTAIFYLLSTEEDWEYSRALTVSQGKYEEDLSVESTSLSFGGGAESQTVKVTANCNWEASSQEQWVNLSGDITSGLLRISVDPNPEEKYRTATVFIRYGENKSVQIRLSQSPSGISVSEYSLKFENQAAKTKITIESEVPWLATASEDWISITPDRGDAGAAEVYVEVTPNTSLYKRTGHVLVQTGNTKRAEILIIQDGININPDQSYILFGSGVESKSLGIQSNTTWNIITKPDWISVSPAKGTGNGQITLTSSDNPGTNPRTGELTVGQTGLSIERKIRIEQKGKTLSTDTHMLEFSHKGGELNFTLESDARWTSSTSESWFAATPVSGNGDAVITVSVEENVTEEERFGTIQYSLLDKYTTVGVHQTAKYLTVETPAFEFSSKGGSHSVDILTNNDWTAETDEEASWLSLSKTAGSGSDVIYLTADDNPSVNQRSAILTVRPRNGQNVRIHVTQKPRFLNVSLESILFFAAGGVSESVEIATDGQYEIKGDAYWFSIEKGEFDTFTVVAGRNLSGEMRKGKILIWLTDLEEGELSLELPVIQGGEGGSFVINGYGDDADWNPAQRETLNINLSGYPSDKDWDKP